MRNFQIPVPVTTTSKSISFPDALVDQVEEAIRGRDCSFSAFVVAAVRSALESLSREKE